MNKYAQVNPKDKKLYSVSYDMKDFTVLTFITDKNAIDKNYKFTTNNSKKTY